MPNPDIEKRLEMLGKIEQDYKVKKEMLTDSLKADDELTALEEKAKEEKKRAQAAKEALMNEPANAKLQEQLKELAIEIRDTKKLLADELFAYVLQNQSTEYIDSKGEKRRIAVSAKLARGDEDGE